MSMNAILEFWFADAPDMAKWFMSSKQYDDEIRTRFGDSLRQAERGELQAWVETPRGFVALVVLLDQFSRQVYRGTGKAFQNDEAALLLVRSKLDAHVSKLDKYEKMFAIMPMMHAENLDAQRQCVAFVEKEAESGDGLWKNVLGHAKGHCDVIERFGRFPKRNVALNRETTEEEKTYIDATPNVPY